jgi:Fe2+ or Zn2+ uptake regulation protein
MRTPTELTLAFRSRGLKVTPQRQLLFALLHDNTTHPSAEALHLAASARMPGISLRTVYQTLHDLVDMGELQHIRLDHGSARFDPKVDEHHHLVCDECGDVRDVYARHVAELRVDGLDGFHVDSTDVVFRGRCAECAARGA